jgi:hypothetical protein
MINTLKYENLIDSFILSSTNTFYWLADFPSSCDFHRFSRHKWAGVDGRWELHAAPRFANSLTKSCEINIVLWEGVVFLCKRTYHAYDKNYNLQNLFMSVNKNRSP